MKKTLVIISFYGILPLLFTPISWASYDRYFISKEPVVVEQTQRIFHQQFHSDLWRTKQARWDQTSYIWQIEETSRYTNQMQKQMYYKCEDNQYLQPITSKDIKVEECKIQPTDLNIINPLMKNADNDTSFFILEIVKEEDEPLFVPSLGMNSQMVLYSLVENNWGGEDEPFPIITPEESRLLGREDEPLPIITPEESRLLGGEDEPFPIITPGENRPSKDKAHLAYLSAVNKLQMSKWGVRVTRVMDNRSNFNGRSNRLTRGQDIKDFINSAGQPTIAGTRALSPTFSKQLQTTFFKKTGGCYVSKSTIQAYYRYLTYAQSSYRQDRSHHYYQRLLNNNLPPHAHPEETSRTCIRYNKRAYNKMIRGFHKGPINFFPNSLE